MKKSLFLISISCFFMSCSFFSNLDVLPSFTEIQFENIAANHVDVYCTLESSGSFTIDELGFVVSNQPDAASTGTAYTARVSRSDFYLSITNLTPNTKYYISAYAKLSNGKYYVGQEFSFTTLKQGNYSSAKVESGNYKIDLKLSSCMRAGNRVTIEATILNKSISPYTNFRTYYIGDGNTAGVTHVEDDVFTDYVYSNLNQYLNNTSGTYIYGANLPIGATKKFTITVDNVPHSAKTISVYIAGEFRDVSPVEYCYLTFENVPIY